MRWPLPLGRWLVAFNGLRSGEWLFLALTSDRQDADMIAKVWHNAYVFDLADYLYDD